MTLKDLINETYWLLRQDDPQAGDLSYPYEFVKRQINNACKEMQLETGALTALASIDLTAGTRTATLPTDFETVKLVSYVFASGENAWPLQRWPLQEFAWPISTGSGMPTYYHIEQGTIYLDVTPNDSAATLDLYYHTISGDLSLPETSPGFSSSFHHYLPFYAAYICKLRDGSLNAAEQFKRLFEDGKRELRRKTQLDARNNQDFGQVRMECYGND